MSPRSKKPSVKKRTAEWMRHEERYQEEMLEEGIKNVDSLFVALWRGIVSFISRALHAIGHAAAWPFVAMARGVRGTVRAIKRGVRRAAQEFMVVMGEIGHDIRHLVGSSIRAAGRGIAVMFRPFTKAAGAITAPVSKRFASKAKQEALADITMTPDHKSHWELLALIGVVVLAVVGLLIATGNAGSLSGVSSTSQGVISVLSPDRLLAKLSTASPVGITIVAASLVLLAVATWFWIHMTLDAWRRTYPTHLEQTRWRVITIGLFIPGAVIYFFNVYNRWGLKQFVTYHAASVVVVITAVVMVTSTYGTLWYFNKQADAAMPTQASVLPKLELDSQTRQGLLNRPQYGAPLAADSLAGRIDPFAPVPGISTQPTPQPSASPSPSPSPQP